MYSEHMAAYAFFKRERCPSFLYNVAPQYVIHKMMKSNRILLPNIQFFLYLALPALSIYASSSFSTQFRIFKRERCPSMTTRSMSAVRSRRSFV